MRQVKNRKSSTLKKNREVLFNAIPGASSAEACRFCGMSRTWWLPEFVVVPMPRFIAYVLLFKVLSKGFREIDARLVGQADDDPQDVGQLVAQVE